MKKAGNLKSKGKVLPASNKTDRNSVEDSESLDSCIKDNDEKKNGHSKSNIPIPLLYFNPPKTDTPIGFYQDDETPG